MWSFAFNLRNWLFFSTCCSHHNSIVSTLRPFYDVSETKREDAPGEEG